MTDDRRLQRVIEVLKASPPVSPDLDRRILAALRNPPARRRPWLLPIGLAGVVAAAAVLVLVIRTPALAPSRAFTSTITPVEFAIELPAASEVRLVGDFNDWDRSRTPLARAEGDGRWRATLSLHTGLYRYAFLVDGARWVADPRQPGPADADFGQPVSLLTVE